jgi:hypothetical protein
LAWLRPSELKNRQLLYFPIVSFSADFVTLNTNDSGPWLSVLHHTLDRIEGLEQELARLKEELRQSREASSSDAHPGGAVNLQL